MATRRLRLYPCGNRIMCANRTIKPASNHQTILWEKGVTDGDLDWDVEERHAGDKEGRYGKRNGD